MTLERAYFVKQVVSNQMPLSGLKTVFWVIINTEKHDLEDYYDWFEHYDLNHVFAQFILITADSPRWLKISNLTGLLFLLYCLLDSLFSLHYTSLIVLAKN